MTDHIEAIKKAVIEGKHKEIENFVRAAMKDMADLDKIINESLISAMDVVGEKFGRSEIYVPEMLISAKTMKMGLEIMRPMLEKQGVKGKGRILMGTVKGDLHDIGKNLVIMILEGAGFDVIDLGVDLTVEKVVEMVERYEPDVLGLSALLTTTMPEMKKVIKVLDERGFRDRVKIMVGGAPVNSAFASRIGADGYGKDASEAVTLARKFIS